jgi:hypothetical protein
MVVEGRAIDELDRTVRVRSLLPDAPTIIDEGPLVSPEDGITHDDLAPVRARQAVLKRLQRDTACSIAENIPRPVGRRMNSLSAARDIDEMTH